MFIPVVLELREKHTLVDNPDVNQAYPVLGDDPGLKYYTGRVSHE